MGEKFSKLFCCFQPHNFSFYSIFVTLNFTSLKFFFVITLFISIASRPMYHVGYFAYFQLNIDYIIEKYCVNKDVPEMSCNGKCHLSKQLLSSSSNDGDSNNSTLHIVESFFPLYFHFQNEIEFSKIFVSKKEVSSKIEEFYTFDYSYFHFKPPIV